MELQLVLTTIIAVCAFVSLLGAVFWWIQRPIYARMDRLDSRMDRLDSRMDRIESKVDQILHSQKAKNAS